MVLVHVAQLKTNCIFFFRTVRRKIIGYEVRSVNTAWGVVNGEVVHPDGVDLAPVTQFLGVPYGVAPSGQFRFNMAISAAKWTHLPKEARKLAPACIQTQLPELSETRLGEKIFGYENLLMTIIFSIKLFD
ncbi:unnamed protein product [Cylicostephanus goldi]|uniref:Carboxylesterase type B domain-containing protein n=1 Tax=Cylicostephanus goldi TaxID=71465 RepID=A0A3P7Q1S9_CYLGO|nr:unnamed protein product [Cylicostephanus goldi]